MQAHYLPRERGFLAIVAVVLTVIIGMLGVMATRQFTNNAISNANDLNAMQAFYSGISGIEYGNYNVVKNAVSCTAITGNGSYTNASLSGVPGRFTLAASKNTASDTLGSNINSNTGSIPLNSSSGFASSGVVSIDNELITYSGIGGNNLTGASRGVGGTTAASHATGAAVIQQQCTLGVASGVPSLSGSSGLRAMQTMLSGQAFSLNLSGTTVTSVLTSAGSVSMSGNASIVNPGVTSASPNFTGSTIVSGKSVSMSGSADTEIGNGSGGLTSSSTRSKLNSDVIANSKSINSGNLFGNYFNQSEAVIQANANQSYSSKSDDDDGGKGKSSLNGVTGQTIWMTKSLSLSGNTTIGSPTSPVILIVDNSVSLSGNVTIYGFVYAMGSMSLGGNVNIVGGAASEDSVSMSGSSRITLNTGILNQLNTINSNTSVDYTGVPTGIEENYG